VQGTATSSGQTNDVYLDMIVVGRGRLITTISITSFSDPVDSGFERRLARAAAHRMPVRALRDVSAPTAG
jgi:hypothetical protein